MLHDARTIVTLSALVADDRVATAECTIVYSAEAIKGWSVSIGSAGAVIWAGDSDEDTVQPLRDSALLPRSTYPVAMTGTALWMARASWLAETGFSTTWSDREMVSPRSNSDRLRLCTSLISASSVTEPAAVSSPIPITGTVPPSLRIKVLHG